MNISTKSLLILIFLCIFTAEINNKRNFNMKKLDIKRALSEHNMTQVELYQKIGMSPQAICMIIKNNNPTVAKLMQIAEGIGCDITDLFYLDPADETAEKAEKERKAREMVESIQKKLTGATGKKVWVLDGEQATTHRTTLGAPNWSGLTDKDHQFAYGSSPLAFPAVEWSGEGKNIEKLMKDLEAEKENGQENAQPEGTQQGNIQPESAKTTIQTSTFCPHCGKKVRVGVVLLPEE